MSARVAWSCVAWMGGVLLGVGIGVGQEVQTFAGLIVSVLAISSVHTFGRNEE